MAYEMSGSEPFELIGTVEDMGDGNVSISCRDWKMKLNMSGMWKFLTGIYYC